MMKLSTLFFVCLALFAWSGDAQQEASDEGSARMNLRKPTLEQQKHRRMPDFLSLLAVLGEFSCRIWNLIVNGNLTIFSSLM